MARVTNWSGYRAPSAEARWPMPPQLSRSVTAALQPELQIPRPGAARAIARPRLPLECHGFAAPGQEQLPPADVCNTIPPLQIIKEFSYA